MAGPQSIKEYWGDPKRNRRKAAGRREEDYAVCQFHEQVMADSGKHSERVCDKIKAMKQEHEHDMDRVWGSIGTMREQIVGKFTFRLVVGFFAIVFVLISIGNTVMLQKMMKDIDHLQDQMAVMIDKR